MRQSRAQGIVHGILRESLRSPDGTVVLVVAMGSPVEAGLGIGVLLKESRHSGTLGGTVSVL